MRNRQFDDEHLDEALRRTLPELEAVCERAGYPVLLYCGLRDPWTQARTFRASRTVHQIRARAVALVQRGYEGLADILDAVGPQYGVSGAHHTNAGPGESWHQYGAAVDACPLIDGRLAWEYSAGDARVEAAWTTYGQAAEHLGLHWGGRWKHPDRPHIQTQAGGNPLDVLPADAVRGWIDHWTALEHC